jgi:uncharacterized protein
MVSLGIPFFTLASGLDPMNIPKIDQFVEDYSSVLSRDQISELRNMAENHEKNTTEQAVTIIFPNRNGYELADIGLKVFRENGIGQKDTNNGILLLIATEEKKIRIVTGYGMEWKVPDTLAKQWIEEDIRPRVNTGDYPGAIRVFYERLEKKSPITTRSWESLGTDLFQESQSNSESIYLMGIIILCIGWVFLMPAILVSMIIKNRLKKELLHNGISVKEAKFSSTNKLLQSPESTSWYNKSTDASYTSYAKWDTENKSLSEHFPVLGITKKWFMVFVVSIVLSIIPDFIFDFSLVTQIVLPLCIFSCIFYVLVSRSIKESLKVLCESREFEEYKNGDKTLYDVVWLSPPSSNWGWSRNRGRSSGGGWGFRWGGGSSGGGWAWD